MTKDEALKMAIDALNDSLTRFSTFNEMQHDAIQACIEALAQPVQEPVSENDISKAFDFLNAVPNGYSFQPIDQERFERYVVMIAKQIKWLQIICADYAETAVKDGERKIKDAQAIKKLFTHQKKWQRLSDNKITNLFAFYGADTEEAMMDFARAIEQALKEKNT